MDQILGSRPPVATCTTINFEFILAMRCWIGKNSWSSRTENAAGSFIDACTIQPFQGNCCSPHDLNLVKDLADACYSLPISERTPSMWK
jgi:hypothetical protein